MDGRSAVGGGTTPGLELASRVVALRHRRQGADWLDASLRHAAVPVVGRIDRDRLILDLRTVLPDEDGTRIRPGSDTRLNAPCDTQGAARRAAIPSGYNTVSALPPAGLGYIAEALEGRLHYDVLDMGLGYSPDDVIATIGDCGRISSGSA